MNREVVLSLIFVLSGTFNVLVVKWSYNLEVEGSDGEMYRFFHPVFLTFLMFFGNFLSFNRRRNEDQLLHDRAEFKPLRILLPALLDAVASITLFTGLYLTYATSFQMIRASAMIFVGFFGTILLNQSLGSRHWLAIISISCGVIHIVSTDLLRVDYDQSSLAHYDRNSILTGDLLIITAEVLHAMQYVYEEKILKTTDVSIRQANGWKGIFGMIITLLLAVCFNYVPASFNESSRGVFDDWIDVWYQLKANVWLNIALIMFFLSCAAYDYVGMAIMKFSSTGNRLLADYLRVYFIWIFVILLEWEDFNLMTMLGLIILQMGIVLYRHAIFADWLRATLARWQRSRYMDLNEEQRDANVPQSRPADVI
ncbi:solute carrier family 35 member F6 [Drosophila tropicalis]|uniref:solute carrier family 35 member F6 n=1 Tax=Drosophila tropicalis TaxID=46794 RepID=UPI0035AB9DBD